MNEESITRLLEEHGFDRIEVRKPSHLYAFQIVGRKGRRGLSLVAGEGLYSVPRYVTSDYSEVEVGLLVDDHLRYCTENSEFFAQDVESYVDEKKLCRIMEAIGSLRLSPQVTCKGCGRKLEKHSVKDGLCFFCRNSANFYFEGDTAKDLL